ncbi:LptF/LptG family permease [Rhizomicrobium electricum]|uniref:Permease n=1 Tax=Rhizomicrobium electricum TaxID=480070 RepID=A0ABN1EH26_9PROT|nr:LptF/LptG family permease [Rhizomicrobium electricum]NIJ48584.1 lipopolysaccharide export LptBFGC system permease protein LptF [Rhizomicrobium electricum]
MTDAPARPRSLAGLVKRLTGPFTLLYARRFFSGVALLVFTVMVLFEAVFVAERFPMVFRAVYQNHADPRDMGFLLLCNSTQVVDLALAIAILVGTYWTVLKLRENRELLVLVAAGTGPFQLIGLALAVAVVGMFTSLYVSSVLDPAARFAEREVLFQAEFRGLRTGINTGQFYDFPGRVAFAPARQAAGNMTATNQTRGLFVYEELKDDKFRVVTADHASLEGPDASGRLLLKLGGFTSQTFDPAGKSCKDCGGTTTGLSQMATLAGDITQTMRTEQLLSFEPRGAKADELTIFDQFAASEYSGEARHRDDMRLLGERLARSFLCLLAPLIALACVCLTNRTSNYFALPLACMVLMSLNVTSEWLIRVIVPLDPWGALRTPALLTLVIAAMLLAEIFREQGKLAQPQLGRP